jgi:hypothetical protein
MSRCVFTLKVALTIRYFGFTGFQSLDRLARIESDRLRKVQQLDNVNSPLAAFDAGDERLISAELASGLLEPRIAPLLGEIRNAIVTTPVCGAREQSGGRLTGAAAVAATRPWTVVKNYRRDPSPHPTWNEENCPETNNHARVGTEDYMISADGFLMPTR